MKHINSSIQRQGNACLRPCYLSIHRCLIMLVTMVTMLATPLSQALTDDTIQTVEVSADLAVLNHKQGSVVYRGNVILIQGSIKLLADELLVQSRNQRITIATATGKPAQYQQQMEDGSDLFASGQTIIFNAEDDQLTIQGQALLQHSDNRFLGGQIIYDITSETVQASGQGKPTDVSPSAKQPKERIRMIIQPPAKTDQIPSNKPLSGRQNDDTENPSSVVMPRVNKEGNSPQ